MQCVFHFTLFDVKEASRLVSAPAPRPRPGTGGQLEGPFSIEYDVLRVPRGLFSNELCGFVSGLSSVFGLLGSLVVTSCLCFSFWSL
jgi:hypothetical protein